MRTPIILVMVAALLGAGNAQSQVSITNVDKPLETGITVTVTGAGFGTKAVSAPFRWDDLSSAAYSNLSDGDVPPTRSGGYGHPQDSNAPWNNMDSSYPEASTVYEISPENIRVPNRPVYSITGGRGSINGISLLQSPTMIVDYWFYSESCRSFPVNSDGDPQGDAQSKLVRIWPDPNKTYGHNSIYPGRVSYDVGPTSDDKARVYSSLYPQEGKWTHITLWLDGRDGMSEGGSHGIFQAWSDNQLKINVNDMGWLTPGATSGAGTYTYLALLGLDPIDRSVHIGKKNFFGDVYVDTTPQRVVVADAATWSNTSHFEMQVPRNWGTTSIEFTANLGSFAAGESLWLYVFNADGVPNANGFGITGDITPIEGPGQPGQPAPPN